MNFAGKRGRGSGDGIGVAADDGVVVENGHEAMLGVFEDFNGVKCDLRIVVERIRVEGREKDEDDSEVKKKEDG